MLLLVVFTLAGLILGASLLGYGGWFSGALLGFLVGQFIRLNNKLEAQRKELEQLKDWRRQLEQKSGQAASSTEHQANSPQAQNPVLAQTDVAQPTAVARGPSSNTGTDASLELEFPESAVASNQPAQVATEVTTAHNAMSGTDKAVQTAQVPPQSYPPTDPISKAFTLVRDFFTKGNPIVRAGMVVMFFGLSFLAKYAAGQGLFPVELRLSIISLVAIALVAIGWKTRHKEAGYGLVLQGGGVAALYLTLFAAAKMFSLMPLSAALVIMILVVVLGAALALLQNAQVLALMATAGGFLAPLLTSDGTGNHVGLFSYYLVLNLGVLAIAWFKTWRMLNWIGFVFTFVISSAWGLLQYQPAYYTSTQPFLVAYFALYLLVAILFSLKQPPKLTGLVDASLVFGLPIVAFGLQTALLKHTEYGLAVSAFILALVYSLLAKLLWARYRLSHQALIESFIALAICFTTLTIPLALGAQWTSASWALEASGLLWIGMRQARRLPRAAGYLLHIAAAFSLLLTGEPRAGVIPLLSGDFLSLSLLAFTALAIAYLLNSYANSITALEKSLQLLVMLIGWGWWLWAMAIEVDGHIDTQWHFASSILLLSASCATCLWLSRRMRWPGLNRLGYTLLPLVAFVALISLGDVIFTSHNLSPLANFGWLALPLFFALQYRFLWLKRQSLSLNLVSSFHVLTAWLFILLIVWQLNAWENQFAWSELSAATVWFIGLALPMLFLLALAPKEIWPFAAYAKDYRHYIPAPLALLLLIWFFFASQLSGQGAQLYLPLINPLDITQAGLVVMVVYWVKRDFFALRAAPKAIAFGLPGVLAFAWLNLVMLRAIHHYLAIDYTALGLWNSSLVQMALSILWGLCALVIMNTARRWQQRQLWLLGVSLLVVIILKLVFKDMSGRGTLAGIISFVAVGALMLIIGYLSPMPAKKNSNCRPA